MGAGLPFHRPLFSRLFKALRCVTPRLLDHVVARFNRNTNAAPSAQIVSAGMIDCVIVASALTDDAVIDAVRMRHPCLVGVTPFITTLMQVGRGQSYELATQLQQSSRSHARLLTVDWRHGPSGRYRDALKVAACFMMKTDCRKVIWRRERATARCASCCLMT